VTGGVTAPLTRAREEIEAARALLAAGFPSQAVSRAYLSGFHAASAALLALGAAPLTRTGVVSAFGRHAVVEGGLEHEAGRRLRRLRQVRDEVDYGLAQAPAAEAELAIADAEELLTATERWLERRLRR
jgi:uncharacterized protein (UPF0332 family)